MNTYTEQELQILISMIPPNKRFYTDEFGKALKSDRMAEYIKMTSDVWYHLMYEMPIEEVPLKINTFDSRHHYIGRAIVNWRLYLGR